MIVSLSAPRAFSPEVREASSADEEKVCSFLAEHMGRQLTAEHYRAIFSYPWMGKPPNRGFLLEASAGIVGYIGAIYADRLIQGRTVRFCNLTNWCVLPEFRKYSTSVLTPLLQSNEIVVTNFSPIPEVEPIFEWMGFTVLDEFKWFSVPGINFPSLVNRFHSRLIVEKEAIKERLSGPELQAFQDHQGIGCLHTVVVAKNQQLYVVSRKRRRRGLTFSEILYASCRHMLHRHLERLKLSILRRDRTFVLACDERIYGKPPRGALKYRRVSLVKSSLPEVTMDNLYSEIALL